MHRPTSSVIVFTCTALLCALPATPAENPTAELSIPLYNQHAEEEKQLQGSSAETIHFAPGGLIHIRGSYGDLVVEGWEQPTVEISVTKLLSYGFKEDKQRLERVRVASERKSDSELSISTIAAPANMFLRPFGKGNGVAVEYNIKVPRHSKLDIRHGVGMVTISNIIGDIEATGHRGDVMISLPDVGTYAIDARSKFGVITSDFAGSPTLAFYRVGERFASENTPPAPRIRLRMGFGSITIKRLPRESLAEPVGR